MVQVRKCAIAVLGLMHVLACEPGMEPPLDNEQDPPPGAIAITSPIGDKMAADRSVLLTADPGMTLEPIAWSSSETDVATIDQTGTVFGLHAGATTITASAGGMSGRYTMTVVEADLEGMITLLDDRYLAVLISVLQDGASIAVSNAVPQCKEGLSEGHITNLELCLMAAGSAVASPSEASDAPLTTTVGLLIAHLRRLLNA